MTDNLKGFFIHLSFCLLMLSVASCDVKAAKEDSSRYFIGTNMWYASSIAVSEPERLRAELDSLKAYGIDNVRVLATDENWDGMDALLGELSSRKMQAVLFLNNAWEWSKDGYRSYLEKAGAGRQPHPATDGYHVYMPAMAAFAQNAKAVELYQEHVRKVVERYKGSDAIYSWQICNEPRPFSTEPAAVEAFYSYVHGTAALIKSIDPDHMVSTGNEGQMGCEKEMSIYEKLNDCADIDYITIHIWPYNWKWVEEGDIAGGAAGAVEQIGRYIDSHLQLARRLGKKVVIEEFGYPRDAFSFSRKAPVTGRDAIYKYVFARVLESARNADVLLGCNFWAWSGLARQTPGHDFWQEGDDLCGDPFQEGQGLNGVYLSDTSTLSIVRAYTDSLANVVSVNVPVEHDWMFFGKGPFKLAAEVSSNLPLAEVRYSVRRDLDLMDASAAPVLEGSVQVRTRPGRAVRTSISLGNLEPGFYQVCINGSKSFNIGVNPEQIQSPSDAPEDFDAFWQSTLSELAEVPMEVKWTLLPEHSSLKRECYRVEMPSWGGATMGGIIFIPTAEGRYPVRMNFMGYGADVYYEDPDWHADRIDYTVSVRDQGIFKEGNSRWIDRVAEIVGYAETAGLYAIVNTHHDECNNDGHWLNILAASVNPDTNESIKAEIKAVWTQIADRFKDKGEWLILESFNEIQDGGWGNSAAFRANPSVQCNVLNQWNQAFVDAVRATGGNNATRWLGVPTYAANPGFVDYFVMPSDPAGKMMLAFHCYDPYDFTIGDAQYSDWGHTGKAGNKANGSDEEYFKALFNKFTRNYVNKGIPVYIGEFGCSMRNKSDSRSWAFYKYYLEYVVKAAKTYGLPAFLWDNGAPGYGKECHGYINHGTGDYMGDSKEVVDIMTNAMNNASPAYTLETVYAKAPKN